jgi:hypothetical protein
VQSRFGERDCLDDRARGSELTRRVRDRHERDLATDAREQAFDRFS